MTDTDDLARATAGELVDKLARRELSARELCDLTIARIERDDPVINAVVVRDFERAQQAAELADAAIARGERAPLLGLPMTVKESFNVAGLPTSWGISEHADYVPKTDAVTVARLKQAGAVILGKTNVARSLADWQSINTVYGRTNHPLDHGYTPGGSSGGSAAALSAHLVPLELGSDIAGSIRVPAHFCGVCGHKPSEGLLPNRGHDYPRTEGSAALLAVVGPMARCIDDLERALDVLAGPDAAMAVAYRLALPPPRKPTLQGLRVLALDQHPMAETASALRGAIAELCRDLAKEGAKVAVESPLLPDLAGAQDVFLKLFGTLTSGGGPLPDGTQLSAGDWLQLMGARAGYMRAWAGLFEQFDVVVTPPFGTTAFPHFDPRDRGERHLVIDGAPTPYLNQFAWPSLANLAGLPATAVPIANTPEGLPIGVQVIGPYLEDRTPLAAARAIEKLRPRPR